VLAAISSSFLVLTPGFVALISSCFTFFQTAQANFIPSISSFDLI
jgi:hypothetical protein